LAMPMETKSRWCRSIMIRTAARIFRPNFRRAFVATNDFRYTNLLIRLLRDDGRLFISTVLNFSAATCPPGRHARDAGFAQCRASEKIPVSFPPTSRRPGCSMEQRSCGGIHQVLPVSADISFDLELIAEARASRPPWWPWPLHFPVRMFSPEKYSAHCVRVRSDGTIARVEFFADGASIGLDSQTPFTAIWSNVSVGPHTFLARATTTRELRRTVALGHSRRWTHVVSAGSAWRYFG
jgi:hypothetical protein